MKTQINAGEFSQWLKDFIDTMKGRQSGNVPCGECVGCCTSSKFILVRPTDNAARTRIPDNLLFPAPGLPEGFDLLGYNEQGHCPMFIDGGCSIYPDRPETCRQYDCRVLAATGAETQDESDVMAERIDAWEFSYANDQSRRSAAAIKSAMEFLNGHAQSFPDGYVPPAASQRAALAVRVHETFLTSDTDDPQSIIATLVESYPVR
ncbi:YkgJ family cysteine cluster protein [Reinekea blandensis]|uniref:YkgJ family cysteine cluster protein n=1 Tax=Reinekea blandensis MED297 TaxID=314283 RepID=A4BD17_9GAMM|nr:YkgJ family cysteine cluster protein [Reinekea blandensis]EAR10099.1 hypothetical protein MED297_08421 [Reinekea sp. MED297] [Reinekea blandensis MED297]